MDEIPHSRPSHDVDAEAAAVREVLALGQTSRGGACQRLEQEVSIRLGGAVTHAAPSGAMALWLALWAVGVRFGDHVVIPAYTCGDVAHAVTLAGAVPLCADVDDRYNLNADSVAHVFTDKVRAIVVTHQFGFAADVTPLRKFGVPVVEDLAHAVGGSFAGQTLGQIGQAGCLSFHATKMLSSGEGGMAFARGEAGQCLRRLADGATSELPKMPFPDLLAAVALCQWGRLDEHVRRRRQIADAYRQAFVGLAWSMPHFLPGDVFFRCPLRVPALDFARLKAAFASRGIAVRRGVDCLPTPDAVRCPKARQLFEETLSIPIYPTLDETARQRVIAAVHAASDAS